MAFLAVLAILTSACSARGAPIDDSPDARAVKDAVSRFILAAYSEDGDIGDAYALLDSESIKTCSRDRFVQMARTGKQIVSGRKLQIVGISHLRIHGDTATMNVQARMDRTEAHFLREDVTLVRDDGEWHFKITSDPSCTELWKFFDLGTPTAGVRVTPVYEDNPECEKGYPLNCIPRYPPKLECKDIPYRNFPVESPDPHGFDPDHNNVGCEKK